VAKIKPCMSKYSNIQ